jgi:DNA-3-methyladenine glycosylase II
MAPATLDETSLIDGVAELSRRDAGLREIDRRLGPPPLWAREPGYETLVRIILEQQVSLASAAAIFARLTELVVPLTPESVLPLGAEGLRPAGLTRQKSRFVHGLAGAILAGELDLGGLAELDAPTARAELLRVKGVGPWTADIYLLMALGRPDVWPVGDLALARALRDVKGLGTTPGPKEMEDLAAAWRPWRSVAARMLWHHYLSDGYPSRRG